MFVDSAIQNPSVFSGGISVCSSTVTQSPVFFFRPTYEGYGKKTTGSLALN
jgi:hypothetical protein